MPFQLSSRSFLPALALAGLAACSAGKVEPAAATASAQGVNVEVQPPSATLGVGGTVQFAAVVTGTINASVTWRVQEGTGGTVDAGGFYTAPSAAGTYHVVATSVADGSRTATATVTVQPVAPVIVTVSPATATVAASATRAFTASVTGATNTAVTWSVRETSGCGSITSAGVYTAPGAAATCHVVATSAADGVTAGVATVTVTAPPGGPPAVSVTPSPAALDACRSQTFTATVTGTTNTAVDWTVQEAAGGTVTAAGVYTAPDTAGVYHLVATTRATPVATAVVPVTITERVLSVQVTPPVVVVQPNGTAQFTATVTTTCGSIIAAQTVAVAQ